MKEFYTIWNELLGRTREAVHQNNGSIYRACTQPVERVRKGGDKQQKSALTVAVLGLTGVLTALFIFMVNPYDMIYRWKIVFGDGGEIFELWKTPPVELYLKVYLWNVTNRDEYLAGIDDKLQVQDVGPYVYREYMTHEKVVFNENGTLTTTPKSPLVWVPELSEGRREDDLLILPNIALLSIADVVSDESYFTRLGLNVIIRQTKSEPLVQMTAREFMFGYHSTLMTLGNNFMPSWIYFEKLGLIDRMYDFEGDYETIYTGEKHGLPNIGLIDKYNGQTKIPQWDSPCGDISGASDGTKFTGYTKPNDTLKFFRKSMCRAKEIVKVGDVIEDGFNAYLYHFAPDADDNGWVHEKNKCFCKNPKKCLPPGLLDVRGCYYGFPIALSYPHYLDGDESLLAKINGTNADPEKHKSFFIIEPESGLPIKLAVRYQINMALGNIKKIANCERFDNMVLPLLWTEIGLYKLPSWLSLRFKLYITIIPIAQTVIMYTALVVGSFLMISSIFKFVKRKSNKMAYNSPWIEDDFVMNIDRKLSSYIPDRGMSTRELEVFIDPVIRQEKE